MGAFNRWSLDLACGLDRTSPVLEHLASSLGMLDIAQRSKSVSRVVDSTGYPPSVRRPDRNWPAEKATLVRFPKRMHSLTTSTSDKLSSMHKRVRQYVSRAGYIIAQGR